MDIQEWFAQLETESDSKSEYCYALLALHVKNCEKISKAIEEHGSEKLKKAAARPYALDEKVLDELIKEMGQLVEKEQ